MRTRSVIIFIVGMLVLATSVIADDVTIDSTGTIEIGASASGNLEVTGSSGEHGIVGITDGTGAAGVSGKNTTFGNYGRLGYYDYGVYGYSLSNYAGYFEGNALVTGTLTVGNLTGYSESDPVFSVWNKSTGISITESQITNLNHFTTLDEVDPSVPSSIKDGIEWSEVSNRPSGLDDGDDIGITTESDPTVNTLGKASLSCAINQVAKWDGTNWICADDNNNTEWIQAIGYKRNVMVADEVIYTAKATGFFMITADNGQYFAFGHRAACGSTSIFNQSGHFSTTQGTVDKINLFTESQPDCRLSIENKLTGVTSLVINAGILGEIRDTPMSCKAILQDNPASLDGVYSIDPVGGGTPINVWCDMTTDGGGWTIVFNSSDPTHWQTNTGLAGTGEWSHDFSGINFPMSEVMLLYPNISDFKKVTGISSQNLYGCIEGSNSHRWTGTNGFYYAAYHLGITTNEPKAPGGYVDVGSCPVDRRGWGFGHIAFGNNEQGWGWDSNNFGPTVFVIGIR